MENEFHKNFPPLVNSNWHLKKRQSLRKDFFTACLCGLALWGNWLFLTVPALTHDAPFALTVDLFLLMQVDARREAGCN